jgi:hypothetical protein
MKEKRREHIKNTEKDKKTSVDSLKKLTDVEIDYPIIYNNSIDPLGGKYTSEERYPISDMIDDE